MTPRAVTPPEAAALLVAILERRGATFTLRPDDLLVDFNGSDITQRAETVDVARCIGALKYEIRAWLQSQHVRH